MLLEGHTSQTEQLNWPSLVWNVLGGHAEHELCPGKFWYLPPGHNEQKASAETSSENCPGLQKLQTGTDALPNLQPLSHM
jgi:hypothetical protein